MSRKPFVLDTSAILTLIEDEAGADRVQEVLTRHDALIPGVALVECYYVTMQERGAEEADVRHAHLKALNVAILWTTDEATSLTAARLKATHRVSLADALVAAHAAERGATLLHKDPEFEAVAPSVRLEALPYKPSRRR
ncbi:MAG: type II toxin-antitoxin system VapC family toxin [Armatimonadetes bacterium]|nr:type II toxin-antitoxin system VapC family toxin [Armatimonadota bacterium]